MTGRQSNWELVIGLEIHVQLSTLSKMFSGASTAFGAAPNTQASALDLGLPGVLPVVNAAAYPKAIAFGLGVGADIALTSTFDRKNYFYPDLPKGYQITQMQAPILSGGSVEINLQDGTTKSIRITRAHLEEDAGKSLHEDFDGMTGIDLNRAGTPLLEVVSEPDMRSAKEAVAYARAVRELVTYLSVSDGDMSQGSLRCDANVSVRRQGEAELGTRTETKNLNSFRFLERAIEYETVRQIRLLESGGRVAQETRLYDPDRDETRPMRSKETATDYRYFPEPDLLPVVIDEACVSAIRDAMPELPSRKRQRYRQAFGLREADARLLSSSPLLADYFETAGKVCGDIKLAANWVKGELLGRLNHDGAGLEDSPVDAQTLGLLLGRIKDRTVSGKTAKGIFSALWRGDATDVDSYIENAGLKQVTDTGSIERVVARVISDNPKQVEQFRAGKTRVPDFFVGQVMKETRGKADPQQAKALVMSALVAIR